MGKHGDRQVESAPSGPLLERWRESTMLRPIVSGGLWSFLTQSVSKGSVLLATVVGARMRGVADFGLFVSPQAVILLSVSVWDLGLSPMITRAVAFREVFFMHGHRYMYDFATLEKACVEAGFAHVDRSHFGAGRICPSPDSAKRRDERLYVYAIAPNRAVE